MLEVVLLELGDFCAEGFVVQPLDTGLVGSDRIMLQIEHVFNKLFYMAFVATMVTILKTPVL
jgi:hypothetical protein